MKFISITIRWAVLYIISSIALILLERTISAFQLGINVFNPREYSFKIAIVFLPFYNLIMLLCLAPIVYILRKKFLIENRILSIITLIISIILMVSGLGLNIKSLMMTGTIIFWILLNIEFINYWILNKKIRVTKDNTG